MTELTEQRAADASRVALVGAAVGTAAALVLLAGRLAGPALDSAVGSPRIVDVVLAVLGALAAALAYRVAVRRVEGRPPEELPGGGGEAFGTGVFITAGAMGAVLVVLWLLDVYLLPQDPPRWENAPLLIATALFAAVGLQLILQGCVLRGLERVAGTAAGVAASVALFALAVALSGDARGSRAVLGAALGLGVVTACAYVAGRDLWLPIGLHFGYLLVEGMFVPAERGAGDGVLLGRLIGPPLLSGNGQIDASIALAAPLLVLGLGLVARARFAPEP